MTEDQLAEVFNEWLRQWNENPNQLGAYDATYGVKSARYFTRISAELGFV